MSDPASHCVVCSCDVTESEEAVQCDFCERWTHRICPGSGGDSASILKNISDAQLTAIVEDNGAGFIQYFCKDCQPTMAEKFAFLRDLDDFKSKIDSRFHALEQEIANLRQKSAPVNSANDIQAAVEEALEKEKKRLNVVVVGLPESNKDQIRSGDDRKTVLEVAQKLKIPADSVVDIFRDGKVPESPDPSRPFSRIIKVKFSNKDDKATFLRGFKSQLDQNSRTYARHDLTFKQRTKDKALRAQLKRLRDAYPDLADHIVIRDESIYDKKAKAVFDPADYAPQVAAVPGMEFAQYAGGGVPADNLRSSSQKFVGGGRAGPPPLGQYRGGRPRGGGHTRRPRGRGAR